MHHDQKLLCAALLSAGLTAGQAFGAAPNGLLPVQPGESQQQQAFVAACNKAISDPHSQFRAIYHDHPYMVVDMRTAVLEEKLVARGRGDMAAWIRRLQADLQQRERFVASRPPSDVPDITTGQADVACLTAYVTFLQSAIAPAQREAAKELDAEARQQQVEAQQQQAEAQQEHDWARQQQAAIRLRQAAAQQQQATAQQQAAAQKQQQQQPALSAAESDCVDRAVPVAVKAILGHTAMADIQSYLNPCTGMATTVEESRAVEAVAMAKIAADPAIVAAVAGKKAAANAAAAQDEEKAAAARKEGDQDAASAFQTAAVWWRRGDDATQLERHAAELHAAYDSPGAVKQRVELEAARKAEQEKAAEQQREAEKLPACNDPGILKTMEGSIADFPEGQDDGLQVLGVEPLGREIAARLAELGMVSGQIVSGTRRCMAVAVTNAGEKVSIYTLRWKPDGSGDVWVETQLR